MTSTWPAGRCFALGCCLSALLWAALVDPSWGGGKESFCAARALIDFPAPLREIPRTAPAPPAHQLPFGPGALRLERPRSTVVARGRGGLELRGGVEGSMPPELRLEWWANSSLTRVNASGRAVGKSQEIQQFIDRARGFSDREFGFGSLRMPGLYRLQIAFATREGRQLGKYEVVYRVLPVRSRLSLELEKSTLSPGESTSLRIDNRGTIDASYSYGYLLWAGSASSGEVITPEPVSLANVIPLVPAGTAGRCLRLNVPQGLAPGVYTVGVMVKPEAGSRRVVTTQFEVVSP